MGFVNTSLFFLALTLPYSGYSEPAVLVDREQVSMATKNTPSTISLVLSQHDSTPIQLETRRAALNQILKQISDKTGAVIHYSVLPEAPVTATCIGKNVSEIMECLVGKQIGLVTHKSQKDKPAEFWLLGSSVGSCQAVTIRSDIPKNENIAPAALAIRSEAPKSSRKDQSDALLKKLKEAKNQQERVEALTNMVSGAIIEDPIVRRALDEAAIDSDPSIRGQAISTLANLDSEGSKELLASALHDSDDSVRLMAVDQSGEDVDILKQALLDSDATIRDFATMKLEEINKRAQRNPDPLEQQ